MRLLLDEMYPRLIARELRTRGHDVVSVHDSPGAGAPDDQVMDHARQDGRAVVTENVRDFRPLADLALASGANHHGIVFTTDRRWPRSDPGSLIVALEALLASTPKQPVDAEIWL